MGPERFEKLFVYRNRWGCSLRCGPGLVTNSIIFCWLFKIKDQCRKSAFSTNTQSRLASIVVDGVLGPLRLTRHTWWCCCISVVPEATHEASRGPEKGTVSAQKALQGSETETRELLGGTESLICPTCKSMIFFYKKETENNWVSGQTWFKARLKLG